MRRVSSSAVVDHELGAAVGDREQVGGELVGRDAVSREHLDAPLDERRADGVLRRERIRPGRDDLGARLAQREHEAGGLRLEVDDDGDAPARERTVREPLVEQPVEHRHVLPRPVDAPLSLRVRATRDPRHARRIRAATDLARCRCDTLPRRGEVAQLVEHTAENRGVAGSSPALATHEDEDARAKRDVPDRCYRVANVPVGRAYDRSFLRARRLSPAPAEKVATCEKLRRSSSAWTRSSGTQIGVAAPRLYETRHARPAP